MFVRAKVKNSDLSNSLGTIPHSEAIKQHYYKQEYRRGRASKPVHSRSGELSKKIIQQRHSFDHSAKFESQNDAKTTKLEGWQKSSYFGVLQRQKRFFPD